MADYQPAAADGAARAGMPASLLPFEPGGSLAAWQPRPDSSVYWNRRTAAGEADLLPVGAGLTDPYGNKLAFRSIERIVIHNGSTKAATKMVISGPPIGALLAHSSPPATIVHLGSRVTVTLPVPGELGAVVDPGDVITLDPGGDSITYEIAIIGRAEAA